MLENAKLKNLKGSFIKKSREIQIFNISKILPKSEVHKYSFLFVFNVFYRL